MRALVQRVKNTSVTINGIKTSSIGAGLLVLLGVRAGDSESDAKYLAERCTALRIFEDVSGKMNLSVCDVKGEIMVVSQFTLYGDTKKGNRPNFIQAAPPEIAERLYWRFINEARVIIGEKSVATGEFGAMMDVELTNAGPVTILIESKSNGS